jgi:hypothetical protein
MCRLRRDLLADHNALGTLGHSGTHGSRLYEEEEDLSDLVAIVRSPQFTHKMSLPVQNMSSLHRNSSESIGLPVHHALLLQP